MVFSTYEKNPIVVICKEKFNLLVHTWKQKNKKNEYNYTIAKLSKPILTLIPYTLETNF